jgi:two-component system, LytTR family, sensor kinase
VLSRLAKQGGAIIGLWTALGLFYGWEIYLFDLESPHPISLREAIVRPLPDYWIYAVLTPPVLWLASRYQFMQGSRKRTILVHLGSGIAFLTLWVAAKMALYPVYDLLSGKYVTPSWRLFRLLMIDNAFDVLWMYGTIVIVSEISDYYRKFRERELRTARLEAQLAEAQLKVLKMQLDPHFLFNTLHSISSLMHEDVEAADAMLASLSELLRLSLENVNQQEVTLKSEMDFLKGYMEIQQMRFRDRLRLRVKIDPRTYEALVPNMILQPLVENAVKHGISTRTTPGCVEIRSEYRDDTLRLEVCDDGPGMVVGPGNLPATGVGLANTRERLQQMYGDAHSFSLSTPSGGGTLVRLDIPFRLEGELPQREVVHAH